MSSKKIGVIWDKEVNWEGEQPFVKNGLNKDYANYTELGKEENLDLYIANYQWVNGTQLTKAWAWNGQNWEKIENIEIEGVFDKYKFDEETKDLKENLEEDLPVLNNLELEKICKDKLETYNLFSDYVPETREATKENASEMLQKYEKIVFKPRYGFAGEGVKIIGNISNFQEPENTENYILQRFIETDGIPKWGVEGPHDLRTIIIDGELQEVGNYVRVPDEGLISNISRGGNQKYIDRKEIPEEAKKIIEELVSEFQKYNPSIFSVDFMFDKEMKPWVVELNSKPGTYYHHPVKEKEKELPKIKNILSTISKKVNQK